MLCINVLPSSTAFTTLAKLLSVKTISAASFATSDPSCIPKPTSAFFNAGASFTPSPVIATDIPISCANVTRRSFVFGEHLEITLNCGIISFTFTSDIASNSSLVTAKSPGL